MYDRFKLHLYLFVDIKLKPVVSEIEANEGKNMQFPMGPLEAESKDSRSPSGLMGKGFLHSRNKIL